MAYNPNVGLWKNIFKPKPKEKDIIHPTITDPTRAWDNVPDNGITTTTTPTNTTSDGGQQGGGGGGKGGSGGGSSSTIVTTNILNPDTQTSQAPTSTSLKAGTKVLGGRTYQMYYDTLKGTYFTGELINQQVDNRMSVDPSVTKHRASAYELDIQQYNKETGNLNNAFGLFNVKYPEGSTLQPAEYNQALITYNSLVGRADYLNQERQRLNTEYNMITGAEDTSWYGRSVKEQTASENIGNSKFNFIRESQIGNFDLMNAFTGNRSSIFTDTRNAKVNREIIALTGASIYNTKSFLIGEGSRLVGYDTKNKTFDASQSLISYNKGFMTSPTLFKEPFTVNRSNRQIKERPIETGMFLISVFQIGKLGVDLTKVGVAYAKQPIVYEGNRYVGYVTSTTEDTSSGVMTTMPRYKGIYNKALDLFGDSSEFKAQPNFYEFKVKNVPKPKGTPEDITFNAGQVLETKRISEGTFTQRKEFFDVLKSDYMNTDLDVQLYSKRSYNRKGFNGVGNLAGYYQPSTKTIYANLYKSNFLEAKDTLLHEYFHYKYDVTKQKFWTPNKANYGLIKTVLSSTTKIEDKRAIFSLGFKGYEKQEIIEEYLVRQKTARYLRDTNYAPFGKIKVPTTNLGKIGDDRVITNFMTVSKTTPDVMIFKEGNFVKRDVDVGIGLGINKERTATPYYFYSETQQGILPITKGTIYSKNVKTPFTIIQLPNMEKGFGGLPSRDYNIFNTFQQTTNPNTMGNIKKLNIINGMQDLEINQVGLINKVSTVNKVGVINRVGFLDIDNTNLKVNVLNRVGVLNQVGLLNKVIVTNKVGVLNRVGNLNRIKVIERVGLKMDTLQSMRTLQRSKTNILSPRINAPFYPDIPTFIPPFLDIGADFGGLTNRKIKAKRITRYTPSYTALVFGIKGRKPRGVETGARIRPITKGFSWFKL